MHLAVSIAGLSMLSLWAKLCGDWQEFHDKFEASHSPLTDEEFLALFDQPVNPEVALKVRQILASISGLEESRIRSTDRLFEELLMQ